MNSLSSKTDNRRYDLDWLRVIMIMIIFLFHTSRFFDPLGWHVKNPTTYIVMEAWTTYLASWIMPIIFLISGASLFFSLGKGNVGRFALDKVLRLLVPILVGSLTHVSLQVYLERVTHHQFTGSFFAFYPHYFEGMYGDGGNFAWMGLHLWYLLALFIFSLVFYPVFLWLKTRGASLLHALGNLFSLPGLVYLLATPVVLLIATIDPRSALGDRNTGGWNLLSYIPFLFYGFLILSHDRLQDTIRRYRWVSLGLALANTAAMLYAGSIYGSAPFGTTGYTLVNGLFGLNAWLWALTLLGHGLKRLNVTSPFLRHANEAVMPFYILHQTVLLCVGYFVTASRIPDAGKFFLIFVTSFLITISLVEIVLKVNVLRVLFGMKPSPAKSASFQSAAPALTQNSAR